MRTLIGHSSARVPGENPVGQRLNLGILGVQAEIVGVVGHIKQWGLDEMPSRALSRSFIFP
jgi:hypothetical protein